MSSQGKYKRITIVVPAELTHVWGRSDWSSSETIEVDEVFVAILPGRGFVNDLRLFGYEICDHFMNSIMLP